LNKRYSITAVHLNTNNIIDP